MKEAIQKRNEIYQSNISLPSPVRKTSHSRGALILIEKSLSRKIYFGAGVETEFASNTADMQIQESDGRGGYLGYFFILKSEVSATSPLLQISYYPVRYKLLDIGTYFRFASPKFIMKIEKSYLMEYWNPLDRKYHNLGKQSHIAELTKRIFTFSTGIMLDIKWSNIGITTFVGYRVGRIENPEADYSFELFREENSLVYKSKGRGTLWVGKSFADIDSNRYVYKNSLFFNEKPPLIFSCLKGKV